MEETTGPARPYDHLSWDSLQQFLQPFRLQSGLSNAHFSPWSCSHEISSVLPAVHQALLEEVSAQPLPCTGTREQFMRITSRIQYTSKPDVLIIHKPPPATAASPQPPALPDPSALVVYSVISANLGTFNHGPDTVLTFWKRAVAYLQFAGHRADCYPAHRLGLHSIHTNLDACRDSRSLSLISGLRLPFIPSLLEILHCCSTPRLQPVLYYIMAGA